MDKLSILIAESDDGFRNAMTSALTERYCVHACGTGTEALALLLQLHPDVLVLDLMLSEIDGFSLIQMVVLEGIHPKVLATTAIISPYIQETAQAVGIDYIIRTPCCVEAAVMRVVDLAENATNIKNQVAEYLRTLGFGAKQNGTTCLPDAVELYRKNPSIALTKELYPAIGKLCEPTATGKKVEKDIRYAIDCAWKRRDEAEWEKHFNLGRKPTNGEFIARMAELAVLKK